MIRSDSAAGSVGSCDDPSTGLPEICPLSCGICRKGSGGSGSSSNGGNGAPAVTGNCADKADNCAQMIQQDKANGWDSCQDPSTGLPGICPLSCGLCQAAPTPAPRAAEQMLGGQVTFGDDVCKTTAKCQPNCTGDEQRTCPHPGISGKRINCAGLKPKGFENGFGCLDGPKNGVCTAMCPGCEQKGFGPQTDCLVKTYGDACLGARSMNIRTAKQGVEAAATYCLTGNWPDWVKR